MATPDAAMEKLALRWSKLARTCKIVPLGEAVEDRTDTMYQIQLSGLTKVPVPKSLLDKVDGSSKTYKLQMHINATLFHVKKGAFFGNTWTGKREDVDGSNLTREKGGDARWNGKPAVVCSLQLPKSYACIFHTKANLADVRLAAELVRVRDPRRPWARQAEPAEQTLALALLVVHLLPSFLARLLGRLERHDDNLPRL